jgi:microcystin-dependent protein
MADPFVAEIRPCAFSFAPRGWSFCSGATLPISQNTALFSLLGTTFGGDGKVTFALPNLQNCVAVGAGTAAWGTEYDLGQTGGEAAHTLSGLEMPAHNHTLEANSDRNTGNANIPGPSVALAPSVGASAFAAAPDNATYLNQAAIGVIGGGGPHNNVMPSMAINFVIALQGVYPPRS